MALTREQFQELRNKGLTVDQIVKFESDQKPSIEEPLTFKERLGTLEEKLSIPGLKQITRATRIGTKAIGKFFFGSTAEFARRSFKSVEEGIRELGGEKIAIKEGFDVRGGIPRVRDIAGVALETTPFGVGKKIVAAGAKIVKKPLTLAAEKLFRSALKPRDIKKAGRVVTKAEELVKIGLKERVWLTKGGVERVAGKIDDLERQLGDVIEAGKAQGRKISTAGLKSFVDDAKGFFKDQVDVEEATKAIKEIDDIAKNFIKKYGKFIPIEEAQRIKVKTGQALHRYYNKMTSVGKIEGQKQIVRGLKEAIVEAAPKIGDINKRLSDLFKFDQALSRASGRIGNLNLLGLGTKIGAVGGFKTAAVGKLLDLADMPSIKSGAAILLNELAKGAGKGIEKGRVPIAIIISNLIRLFKEE